jgi:hypothetical protein
MRVTVRFDAELADRVAAVRTERGMDMAAVVRKALAAYLTAAAKPTPPLPWREPSPTVAHCLDTCASTLVEHWPPEVQRRLAAEMTRTRLLLRDVLLGVVYAGRGGWKYGDPPEMNRSRGGVVCSGTRLQRYSRPARTLVEADAGPCWRGQRRRVTGVHGGVPDGPHSNARAHRTA